MSSSNHAEARGPRHRLLELITPCFERPNLRRTCGIALLVGCILTLINEGDVLVAGHPTPRTAVKIVLNFCVPFVVSNLGVVSAMRTASATRK